MTLMLNLFSFALLNFNWKT